MAGINEGEPEVGAGGKLSMGSNNEYEIYQDPVTDRLVVKDTVNSETAFVRPETSGQMQGNGLFIRSLIEGKPLADDGRLHNSIQEAERNASGFVFVPPGTFNESVSIDTQGLTLVGAGDSAIVSSSNSDAISIRAGNVTVNNMSAETTGTTGDGIGTIDSTNSSSVPNMTVENVRVISDGGFGVKLRSDNSTIRNCIVENADIVGLNVLGDSSKIINNVVEQTQTNIGIYNNRADDVIIAQNIVSNAGSHGIAIQRSAGSIVLGNRIINSSVAGLNVQNGQDNIVANNRISDSGGSDIDDTGANTLIEGNLTGPSN